MKSPAIFPQLQIRNKRSSLTVATLILAACILAGGLHVLYHLSGWLLADGEASFWQSQFYEADVAYQRALMISMNDAQRSRVYTHLCRLNAEQSAFDAALSSCQAAVQSDADSAQARAEFARTYMLMGRNEMARRYASEALELDGENTAAAAVYGQLLAEDALDAKKADFSQAMSFCDYALMLDEENADSYRALGNVWLLQGDIEKAATQYRKALELKPEFAPYYIDLGFARSKQNELAESMEAYDRALQLLPESASALNGRAWGWWSQGEYRQARQDFKQALLLDEDSDSWAGLGWTYYYDGGSDSLAQNAFEQALDLNPENTKAISGLEVLHEAHPAGAVPADETAPAALPRVEGSRQMLDKAILSAVKIFAFDNQFEVKSSCSGMVLSPQGIILTNLHCIRDAASQLPYNDQWMAGIGVIEDVRQPPVQRYRAQMLAMDDELDVVLLQVVGDWSGASLPGALNLAAVRIGDSDHLNVGDEVWAAGFPGMGGDTLTLTQGMVSGFAMQDGISWVKTDLMTGPGNSGGMVINASGELVGIHAQSWLDQGTSSSRLSAELPVNYLSSLLQILE